MKIIDWFKSQLPPVHERKQFYTMEEVRQHFNEKDRWRQSTLFGKIERNVICPFLRFFRLKKWRLIKYWFKPANILKVKRHTRWTEFAKPDLMFHANFQILVNFFEEEGWYLDNFIKTSWTDEELSAMTPKERDWALKRMSIHQDLRELYEWYTSTSNVAIENMLDGYPPEDDINLNAAYNEKWRQLAENKLRRLIELRGHLWT